MHSSKFFSHCAILLMVVAVASAETFRDFSLSEDYLQAILLDQAEERAAGDFNYDQQGADWPGTCASGTQQSPIDLIESETNETSTRIPRIRFHNYNLILDSPLVITNNGHTANLVIPLTKFGRHRPAISGGPLNNVYEAQSLHFHWGSPGQTGSEHHINSEQKDAELHIVHKNKKYADMTEASQQPDGLAVLGVLYEGVSQPVFGNYGVNRIIDQLPRIATYDSSAQIPGSLSLDQILGDVVRGKFFTYQGSLTTPPCSEAVTWIVFSDVPKLRQTQVDKFYGLQDAQGNPLLNTYRVLQNRNGRDIFYRDLN